MKKKKTTDEGEKKEKKKKTLPTNGGADRLRLGGQHSDGRILWRRPSAIKYEREVP